MNRTFKFFTGRSSRKIAEAIASEYNVELGDQNIIEFSDGEFEPSFNESIRGADIFIIQSTMPPGDNLLELLLMIVKTFLMILVISRVRIYFQT